MKKQIRQGDILLQPVDELQGIATTEKIVAYGEKTGHHHRLVGQAVLYKQGETMMVKVTGTGAALVHEEHAQVSILQGIYRVVHQREFDAVQGVRQVQD